MTYVVTDCLYGTWEVEPVLGDLLHSNPVLRLKEIHQGGASYLVNPFWNVTRYEHSVGVMLLLRKLGAGLEEQIMGLLHDISHTAFSHVVDVVFRREQEDFHEQAFAEMFFRSEVPAILRRHGHDPAQLINRTYPLLDRPLPGLSADRIDYTLRDMYCYGKTAMWEIQEFLQTLRVVDGVICTTSLNQAEWFVQLYYQEVIGFFLDPLNLYGNEMLAKVLLLALDKGILNRDDLFTDDQTVLTRLRQSGDEEIVRMLERIHPRVRVTEAVNGYDFHCINKLRTIDPEVLTAEGELVRASSRSIRVKSQTDQARQRALAGTFVKVLNW